MGSVMLEECRVETRGAGRAEKPTQQKEKHLSEQRINDTEKSRSTAAAIKSS